MAGDQFAYAPKRGARDAIALVALQWIHALNRRCRIGIYCSDVAGAFDRVSSARLIAKLRALGLHEQIIKLVASWLRRRQAHVIIGGCKSKQYLLENMVCQGTVFGTILWNLFFGDSQGVIAAALFVAIVYADDLNAFRVYGKHVGDHVILADLASVQSSLHTWGIANQIAFDANKESQHIMCLRNHLDNLSIF